MGNLDPVADSSLPRGPRKPSPIERALAFAGRHRVAVPVAAGTFAVIALVTFVSLALDLRSPPALRARMGGVTLPDGPEFEAAHEAAARAYLARPFTITIPGADEKLEVTKDELGITLDRQKLAFQVGELRDPHSATRVASKRSRKTEIALPPPVALDVEAALSTLYRLKNKADRFPKDARIDVDARRIVPEQHGRWLDLHGTLARIQAAILEGRDEAEGVVWTTPPKLTEAELAKVEYDEVLGFFETRYSRNQKYEARTYNLWLAASKLDGHVLLPGDVFDFNEVVGPRDEANGYKVATVIAQGELVDGLGGGTCQIAGTLHGAAIFSGLEIVERRPHSRPSSYIKMGLDATVVYPTITLKLRNPFPYPVVLRETVKDGIVRAEVLGPKGQKKTVTFIRKIDGFAPFQEVFREDPQLPKGVKVLAQRGIPGFRLHRYRLIRDGSFAERERWNDYYPPTTQIIRVGTGDMPKDSVKIADDPHPEYVADAYLMMMQGPEVKNPKGMIEVREAGVSGRYGWTERMGFSHWSPGRRTGEGEGEACLEASCAKPSSKQAKAQGDAIKKAAVQREAPKKAPPKKASR